MHRAFAACLFGATCALTLPLAAEKSSAPAPPKFACGDPTCNAPSLSRTPSYPAQIERNGDFSADVTINQPCSCTRQLGMLVAFTASGAKTSHEQMFKLQVEPGSTTQKVTLSKAELAKAKIGPGRYTISFALYDEHDKLAGSAIAGNPFIIGTSHETLSAKPILPTSIGRDSELAIPFVFGNDGDVAGKATALVVFTRPDTDKGIEIYVPNLVIPPGGAKHIVRVPSKKRRELQIGAGAWLVTTSAFDASEQRLASFPGHLLMIGKVLSIPVAPGVGTPIEQTQELSITLTLKNDGEVDDLVTALLIFSGGPGAPKPIEYKIEGIGVERGTNSHPLILSPLDRYNLGIRPGRWQVSVSALDRAGKRLETRRGPDLVIRPEANTTAAQ